MSHKGTWYARELQAANLQATKARIAVICFLKRQSKPTDSLSIIRYLKNTVGANRTTCFRILNSFTKNGIVKKLEFGEGKARYELASIPHHHHLICEQCGAIQDFEDTIISSDIEKKLGRKHDFHITKHALEFFGLCKKCRTPAG